MKQCNVLHAGQWVYIFISLLVKLKPSDNFKKADGQQSQSSNQVHERNGLDEEERMLVPSLREKWAETSLSTHEAQSHSSTSGVGGLETLTSVPHTATISEEHTGGFFAPRTLKGHVQSGFFRSGVIFTSEGEAVPLYRKLPAKTAAGLLHVWWG